MSADLVLKYWVRISAALFAVFVVWNYVPILIPLGVVVGALAGFSLGVRRMADRYRKDTPDPDET